MAKPELEVSDAAFGREFNEALVHQVVTAYRAGRPRRHQGAEDRAPKCAAAAKSPMRRKARARRAPARSARPIWVGGGRTFAAKPRDHSQKVNRKMYQGAMRSMLSELARQDRLHVAEEIALESPQDAAARQSAEATGSSRTCSSSSRRSRRSCSLRRATCTSVEVLEVGQVESGRARQPRARADDGRPP